jgi:hypothetical protein
MKASETTLNQYCVAVLDIATEGQCKRAAGASAGNIAGVLQDSTHVAETDARYRVEGISYVAIASAVAIGDILIVANAAGQVEAKGAGAHSSGVGIVGRALSAATSAGSQVKCHLLISSEYSS